MTEQYFFPDNTVLMAAIEDSPYERTLLERPKRPQDLLA